MDILKQILKYEVFPALGCTEPIAVALASSAAGKELAGEISDVDIITDAGVYKKRICSNSPQYRGGNRETLLQE